MPFEENIASNWESANKIDTVCLRKEAGIPCCFLSRRKVLREKYLEAVLSSHGNVHQLPGIGGADKVAEITWYLSHLTPSLLLALMSAFLNEPSNLLNQQKTFFFLFFFSRLVFCRIELS